VTMTSQMESMVSMEVVERIAREELGMDRRSSYQTIYINLYGEDTILPLPQTGKDQTGILSSMRESLGRLVEYISMA